MLRIEGKTVALLVSQEFEDIEVLYPVLRLNEEGAKIVVATMPSDLHTRPALPNKPVTGRFGSVIPFLVLEEGKRYSHGAAARTGMRRFRLRDDSRWIFARLSPYQSGRTEASAYGQRGAQDHCRDLPRPLGPHISWARQGKARDGLCGGQGRSQSTLAPTMWTRRPCATATLLPGGRRTTCQSSATPSLPRLRATRRSYDEHIRTSRCRRSRGCRRVLSSYGW